MMVDDLERRRAVQLEEAVQPLRAQVRYLRHAIERLLWVNGLVCGVAIAWLIAKLTQILTS